MTSTIAILLFVIGVVMFGVGIVGQVALGKRRSSPSSAGDRAGARIVLTLAAIIVGAWLVIASVSALLHAHAHAAAAAS